MFSRRFPINLHLPLLLYINLQYLRCLLLHHQYHLQRTPCLSNYWFCAYVTTIQKRHDARSKALRRFRSFQMPLLLGGGRGTKKNIPLENLLVYHLFRQLWLVLGVKLMEINSNWFSRPFQKWDVSNRIFTFHSHGVHETMIMGEKVRVSTRWAPTSYKWSYNPYKWLYKWVIGVITLLIGLITPFITGWGPPCTIRSFFLRLTPTQRTHPKA